MSKKKKLSSNDNGEREDFPRTTDPADVNGEKLQEFSKMIDGVNKKEKEIRDALNSVMLNWVRTSMDALSSVEEETQRPLIEDETFRQQIAELTGANEKVIDIFSGRESRQIDEDKNLEKMFRALGQDTGFGDIGFGDIGWHDDKLDKNKKGKKKK